MATKTEVRSQKPEARIENWQEAEAAMLDYARAEAEESELLAEQDAELNRIRARFDSRLKPHQEGLAEMHAALKEFADLYKAEFKAAPDGDGRSYEHAGVLIGFRKLLDKVALPRGDAKKQVALEYLAQYRPEFVRRSPEFNLIALLDALKNADPQSILACALAERGIVLKPGKDEFFLKVK